MENEPIGYTEPTPTHPRRRSAKRPLMIIVPVILAVIIAFGIYILIFNKPTDKDNSDTEKVLTVADLDNMDTQLNPDTSDASVENLTKELKAKIDKQIADKENPIETVRTTIAMLCNTANASRPTQCIDFINDFLNNKMDTLKLTSYEYGQPDELRMLQWRAQFYADLVYAYGSIGNNKVTASNGEPINVVAEQLRYIELYLEIAQNPANWGEPQTADDGHLWYYYNYEEADSLIGLREQLMSGDAQ